MRQTDSSTRTQRRVVRILPTGLTKHISILVTLSFLIGATGALGDTKAKAKLTDNQRIIHLLNRTGFGPRPGDLDRVKKIGIEKYLDEQLHPERINDAATEARVNSFESLRMSIAQLNEKYPNPAFVGRELGLRAPGANPQRKPGDPAPEGEDRDQQREYRQKLLAYYSEHDLKPPALILGELQSQKLIRAVYSERQLQEVLTDFWFNHFNVFWAKGADKWLTTDYEMNVIRPNTLGKFKELVLATAKSPAMLFYLDNFQSSSPDMKLPAGARFNPRRPQTIDRLQRRPQNQMEMTPEQRQRLAQIQNRKPGINENYARELMELHTLGVDGGYTQKDVQEVARCFTGWSIEGPQRGQKFVFRPIMHDDKEKVVLGHKIPAGGGMKDGEMVIEILAHHPSTAKFISTKLVRKFVSDTPPQGLVDRVAAVYTKTDGDVREMLKTIFASPEFNSSETYRAKIKSPFELAASAIRALGGETNGSPRLAQFIGKMGQPLYQYQPPTGYPDRAEQWVNTGALLERLNFGLAISSNRIPGTVVDLRSSTKGIDAAERAKVMDRAIEVLLAGNVSAQSRSILEKQLKEGVSVKGELERDKGETGMAGESMGPDSMMREGPGLRPVQKSARQENKAIRQWENRNPQPAGPPVDPEIAKVFGLVLGSPDFQRR